MGDAKSAPIFRLENGGKVHALNARSGRRLAPGPNEFRAPSRCGETPQPRPVVAITSRRETGLSAAGRRVVGLSATSRRATGLSVSSLSVSSLSVTSLSVTSLSVTSLSVTSLSVTSLSANQSQRHRSHDRVAVKDGSRGLQPTDRVPPEVLSRSDKGTWNRMSNITMNP